MGCGMALSSARGRSERGITAMRSESVEEGEQAVGGAVAAGFGVGWRGAGQGAFLDLHVGVLWRTQISQLSECLSCSGVIGADWRHGWGVAAADFSCVGGPVSGGGALPGDGDRDVDAEHPGE